MDCKRFADDLATLAEGGLAPEAEAHVADCPSCSVRLTELRRIVKSAKIKHADAPADLIARAQALMRPRPRLIARLLGNGLAGAGARAAKTDDFSLLVGTDDVSIPLQISNAGSEWEIMGRAPSADWTFERDGVAAACVPSGRFRLTVSDLADSAFVLRAPGLEIEVPSVRELLDRGL